MITRNSSSIILCLAVAVLALGLAGCGTHEPPAGSSPGRDADPTTGSSTATKVALETNSQATTQNVALDPYLHQPWLEATIQEPAGQQFLPPEVTFAGKSVGKIYKAIVGENGKGGLWEQIAFTSKDGKRIKYSAIIDTEAGEMRLELFEDIAPNHVRNFVALAKAGYYDGLVFERAVKEMVATEPGKYLEYIEAGCPKGTGEVGYGSIGFWMKPEISDKVQHEPGTVGASHAADLETAACKFYITLNRAPWIDGQFTIFGRITDGLEIARKIMDRPTQDELTGRPVHPVVIRHVTIQTREIESATIAH